MKTLFLNRSEAKAAFNACGEKGEISSCNLTADFKTEEGAPENFSGETNCYRTESGNIYAWWQEDWEDFIELGEKKLHADDFIGALVEAGCAATLIETIDDAEGWYRDAFKSGLEEIEVDEDARWRLDLEDERFTVSHIYRFLSKGNAATICFSGDWKEGE